MSKQQFNNFTKKINDLILTQIQENNNKEGLETVIAVLLNKFTVLIAMELIKYKKVKKFTEVERVAGEFAKIIDKEIKYKYRHAMIQEL